MLQMRASPKEELRHLVLPFDGGHIIFNREALKDLLDLILSDKYSLLEVRILLYYITQERFKEEFLWEEMKIDLPQFASKKKSFEALKKAQAYWDGIKTKYPIDDEKDIIPCRAMKYLSREATITEMLLVITASQRAMRKMGYWFRLCQRRLAIEWEVSRDTVNKSTLRLVKNKVLLEVPSHVFTIQAHGKLYIWGDLKPQFRRKWGQ